MKSKGWMRLRSIDPRELARVRGGIGMLLPAVQVIRQPAETVAASSVYITYGGISGDATE